MTDLATVQDPKFILGKIIMIHSIIILFVFCLEYCFCVVRQFVSKSQL